MSETDKSYWLLSETSGIGETRDPRLDRGLPLLEGLRWLVGGLARLLDAAGFQPGIRTWRVPSVGCLRVDTRRRSGATTSCFPRLPGS